MQPVKRSVSKMKGKRVLPNIARLYPILDGIWEKRVESAMEPRVLNPENDFPVLATLINAAANVDLTPTTTETEQKDFAAMFEGYGYMKQWLLDNNHEANDE